MTALPCPQAARSPGVPKPPPPPLQFDIADQPVLPLQFAVAEQLPNRLVDQAITWPYHLPSFNGLDGLWWSMLVRAMYAADQTWLVRVAGWAQPVVRWRFVGRTAPATQGYGLVELQDCVLVVIPGTSSEFEALTYFLTHSLRLLYTSPDGWKINSTWQARGQQILDGYNNWPPAAPEKSVIIIGHSSGAAYGAFVAYSLTDSHHTDRTIATFGAPIWGTPSLTQRYLALGAAPKALDFALPNDFVTAIPPPWALVDVLLPLQYALADRPTYERVNSLLRLVENYGPTPVTTPSTLDALTSAARALLTGAGFNAQHATASYTAACDNWAANDSTIVLNALTPAYQRLRAILADMNAAGLP